MEFNRRGFLIAVIGGSSLVSVGGAWAGAPDRYKRLIELQHNLLASHDAYKAKIEEIAGPAIAYPHYNDYPDTRAHSAAVEVYRAYSQRAHGATKLLLGEREAITVEADYLLGWMMDNFNGGNVADPTILKQVRDLFDGRLQVDTLSEEELRRTEDVIICVAVARGMLSKHKLPLQTHKMDSFTTFAERYKALILA